MLLVSSATTDNLLYLLGPQILHLQYRGALSTAEELSARVLIKMSSTVPATW
jgi:hypothetical protein